MLSTRLNEKVGLWGSPSILLVPCGSECRDPASLASLVVRLGTWHGLAAPV